MSSFSSNDINAIQKIITKNDSGSITNNPSRKEGKLLALNRKNKILSISNKENEYPVILINNKSLNEKNKNKTYINFIHRINPRTNKNKNIRIFNSKFYDNNYGTRTIFNQKSNKNHYNNYYVSSNFFHNDYISDFLSKKPIPKQYNKIDNHKSAEQMKDTDNKIEELVNNLNIYQNKRMRKISSVTSVESEKPYTAKDKTNSQIVFNDNIINDNALKEDNAPKKLTKEKSEKCLIKGTKILSPFCDAARDHYLFKKIFFNLEKKKDLKSDGFPDNKFNILYSENEKQYKQNIIKLNEIYRRLGRNKSYSLQPPPSEKKLRGLKKRVEFMKRIVDYAFPNMVLTKIREQEKKKYGRNLVIPDIITSKINRRNFNKFNDQLSLGLQKSLSIQKCEENK